MINERLVVSEDSNGNEVRVVVKNPSRQDYTSGTIEYSISLNNSLNRNVPLRKDLNKKLEAAGLWNDDKQESYDNLIKMINDLEEKLKKGGLTLKEARKTAIELKASREIFKELIADRISFDEYTAEGIAENARFDYMISVNIFDPETKLRKFKNTEEYNQVATEPWAIKAASEIANMYYKLEKNPEETFLEKFKMIDKEGRLINKDGHLISVDTDGIERLIDKEGFYVAYDSEGNQYKVNRDGKKVEEIETAPFVDEDGLSYDKDGNVIEEEKKSRKKKIEVE